MFVCGCGATGRLAITVESVWRAVHPDRADRVIGFMAGGDAALVRSVEGFEDHLELGARHLDELGFTPADLCLGVTEGGETSYVIGAAMRAAEVAARRPWLLYCNPDDSLRPIRALAPRHRRPARAHLQHAGGADGADREHAAAGHDRAHPGGRARAVRHRSGRPGRRARPAARSDRVDRLRLAGPVHRDRGGRGQRGRARPLSRRPPRHHRAGGHHRAGPDLQPASVREPDRIGAGALALLTSSSTARATGPRPGAPCWDGRRVRSSGRPTRT